jgi:phosphate starvation-inducible PhoH-like protein
VKVPIRGIEPLLLLGERDVHLREIERRLGVEITLRDSSLSIGGRREEVERAAGVLARLVEVVRLGQAVAPADLEIALGELSPAPAAFAAAPEPSENGLAPARSLHFDRTTVRVKTPGQARYVEAIEKHDVVFAIGPAGTGKTYLGVAMAVTALRNRAAERIVLVRPAVEAGESLGFLPGDFHEKVDPYLRPLYDAMRDMMSFEKLQRYLETQVVEIAPLAYMRGRTLSNAFVILDEAQNTTVKQMKMFLTRLGPNSKAVITGDITQIDLLEPENSGLVRIQEILSELPGITFVYFTDKDVVRHRLVRDIIRAFGRHDLGKLRAQGPAGEGGAGAEPVGGRDPGPGRAPDGGPDPDGR